MRVCLKSYKDCLVCSLSIKKPKKKHNYYKWIANKIELNKFLLSDYWLKVNSY